MPKSFKASNDRRAHPAGTILDPGKPLRARIASRSAAIRSGKKRNNPPNLVWTARGQVELTDIGHIGRDAPVSVGAFVVVAAARQLGEALLLEDRDDRGRPPCRCPAADRAGGADPSRGDGAGHGRDPVARGRGNRHEVTQGLRRHTARGRYAEPERWVVELRGERLTADRIAEVLDREGYRLPCGEGFTGHQARQLFMRFGLTRTPAGVRDSSDLPAADEWWLPTLAEELGVKPIVVHRWRWSGWLTARRLRGDKGRWIVRADVAEVKRLRRLRAFEVG